MIEEHQIRNIKAHEQVTRLAFPHKLINLIVKEKIKQCTKRFKGLVTNHLRVLDVGCGTGYLLRKLLAEGWDAWGIDPYPRGEATKKPLINKVIEGTIDKIHTEPFHFITAVEVLEHTEDYMDLLTSMVELLLPNGLLIATVPNQWEFRIANNYARTKEPVYGHLWQFDIKSFRADLRIFSNDALVEPIYSRTIDRRLLRITRILPRKAVINLSRILVKYYENGAWLLGTVRKNETCSETINRGILPRPSAIYYKDSPLFKKEA